METVRQVIDDDPVPPSRLVPRLPRDLETICLKCLNKEPPKRYDSAQALADDLERYLEGEPIMARPTPLWERASKWAKRRPLNRRCRRAGCACSSLGLTGGDSLTNTNCGSTNTNSLRRTSLTRQTGLSLLEEADAARSHGIREAGSGSRSSFPRSFRPSKTSGGSTVLSDRIAEKRK